MKCPKCAYIGFEASDRCKNCGYDFSLVPSSLDDRELPLRADEALGPMSDFDLGTGSSSARSHAEREGPGAGTTPTSTPGSVRPCPRNCPERSQNSHYSANSRPKSNSRSCAPRLPVPLAVRRGGASDDQGASRGRPLGPPRKNLKPRLPIEQARDGVDDAVSFAERRRAGTRDVAQRPAASMSDSWSGSIALVVYFTMRVCRLDLAEWSVLPWPPMLAFSRVRERRVPRVDDGRQRSGRSGRWPCASKSCRATPRR